MALFLRLVQVAGGVVNNTTVICSRTQGEFVVDSLDRNPFESVGACASVFDNDIGDGYVIAIGIDHIDIWNCHAWAHLEIGFDAIVIDFIDGDVV